MGVLDSNGLGQPGKHAALYDVRFTPDRYAPASRLVRRGLRCALDSAEEGLPSWDDADKRMRENGRPSKVRNPSPRHADLTYRSPRTFLAGPIQPAISN